MLSTVPLSQNRFLLSSSKKEWSCKICTCNCVPVVAAKRRFGLFYTMHHIVKTDRALHKKVMSASSMTNGRHVSSLRNAESVWKNARKEFSDFSLLQRVFKSCVSTLSQRLQNRQRCRTERIDLLFSAA